MLKSILSGTKMVIEDLMKVTIELGFKDKWKLGSGKERKLFQLGGTT